MARRCQSSLCLVTNDTCTFCTPQRRKMANILAAFHHTRYLCEEKLKLDLVNFAVRPLLFTKSCSSLNWICSKNEIGWNYSELKDINLKYILSKDSLRYININLPMFCNFQLLNIPIFQKKFQKSWKISSKLPKYCNISIIFVH